MQLLGLMILTIAMYFILGPLVVLIGARILLWLGQSFGLPDALGVFGAEVARAFRAHSRFLDREMGGRP